MREQQRRLQQPVLQVRLSATIADYGDVSLAEYTQPFNENDITYFVPLYLRTVATLGFFPTHLTTEAAFDAWYTYQMVVHRHSIAAIPSTSTAILKASGIAMEFPCV